MIERGAFLKGILWRCQIMTTRRDSTIKIDVFVFAFVCCCFMFYNFFYFLKTQIHCHNSNTSVPIPVEFPAVIYPDVRTRALYLAVCSFWYSSLVEAVCCWCCCCCFFFYFSGCDGCLDFTFCFITKTRK